MTTFAQWAKAVMQKSERLTELEQQIAEKHPGQTPILCWEQTGGRLKCVGYAVLGVRYDMPQELADYYTERGLARRSGKLPELEP